MALDLGLYRTRRFSTLFAQKHQIAGKRNKTAPNSALRIPNSALEKPYRKFFRKKDLCLNRRREDKNVDVRNEDLAPGSAGVPPARPTGTSCTHLCPSVFTRLAEVRRRRVRG
jgi:hypothetical protein